MICLKLTIPFAGNSLRCESCF